jgi:hypothetical protein
MMGLIMVRWHENGAKGGRTLGAFDLQHIVFY